MKSVYCPTCAVRLVHEDNLTNVCQGDIQTGGPMTQCKGCGLTLTNARGHRVRSAHFDSTNPGPWCAACYQEERMQGRYIPQMETPMKKKIVPGIVCAKGHAGCGLSHRAARPIVDTLDIYLAEEAARTKGQGTEPSGEAQAQDHPEFIEQFFNKDRSGQVIRGISSA